jgi:hypothetical protein
LRAIAFKEKGFCTRKETHARTGGPLLVEPYAGGLDHRLAALGHGIACVGDKVHHLLDLHRVSFHFAPLFARNKYPFDAFRPA